jgi:LmbE family N-acetylglucosaminyl deacetylase
VSVSDGGAADPQASALDRRRLESTRRGELFSATQVLGVGPVISLGMADGRLSDNEARITEVIAELLSESAPGTWCAADWRGDGHPDHEAVGRAAGAAAERTGVSLVEYPIWMWHWASPGDAAVPWHRAASVAVPRSALDCKDHAVHCFRSQIEPQKPGTAAVVPPFVLSRLRAVGEVVFR